VPRHIEYTARHDGFGCWAGIETTRDTLPGWISFKPTDEGDPSQVEIGYRQRQAAWVPAT
jgi:hypothetical protein